MKEKTIYILGHKNPDTDSICSSIAYAELKRQLGYKKVIAGRLGEVNKETKFLLDYFNVPLPQLIEDVRSQVADMDYYETPTVYPNTTMGKAWEMMTQSERKMLPVVKPETDEFIGVISSSDITKVNMQIQDSSTIGYYQPTIENIAYTLNASVLAGDLEAHKDSKVHGRVIIAMSPDDINEPNPQLEDIIITRASIKCTKAALSTKARYIFLIGECEGDFKDDFKNIGSDRVVLCTNFDVYTTIRIINQSIPVSSIMKIDDIVYFYESDYFLEVKNAMLEVRYRNFPVLDDNNKVVGTISRRHIIEIDKKRVILVDHNEKSQSVSGLEEAEILEIVDHHRVGDIQTGGPILFRNEPVGSSSTIVASMYFENGITPSKQTAGLLIGGIISDTLLFKSPTCTPKDKDMVYRLAQIACVDVNIFGIDVLKAGASMKGNSMKELLFRDYKEFHFSSRHFYVAQVYTTDLNQVYEIKTEMLNFMKGVCQDKGYDMGILMVTDILGSGTELLYTGKSKDIVQKAFGAKKSENIIFLPNVVSRKKQIIPQIAKYF